MYVSGFLLGLQSSKDHIVNCYVKVPVSIAVVVMILYGVNRGIASTSVVLPGSVICMLALFLSLLVVERVVGTRKLNKILNYIDIGLAFSLRYINVFFTPSITLLPLAQKVSVVEAFKIACVFTLGYLVLFVTTALSVRGLQLMLGTRRQAAYDEEPIELQSLEPTRPVVDLNSNDTDRFKRESTEGAAGNSATEEMPDSNGSGFSPAASQSSLNHILTTLSAPEPAASASLTSTAPTDVIQDRASISSVRIQEQQERPLSRLDGQRRIALSVVTYFDWGVYCVVLVVGIVIFYTTGYPMPIQLSFVVLTYFCALQIHAPYKLVLHPILVCGGLTILLIYISAAIKRMPFTVALREFKTGRNYAQIVNPQYSNVLPGAGDVLSTLLDVSIVALALPMFRYRSELRRFFVILMISCLTAGAGSFFAYPILCYTIGISATRSLAFMARSVTLALALPIVESMGGSTSLVSVVAILSGLIGVLIGGFLLGPKGLRIRPDDYVTRGITLGINSSAISSAHLLATDPRAAALSSLSFFLYATIMVILSVIPATANLVRSMVDLPKLV